MLRTSPLRRRVRANRALASRAALGCALLLLAGLAPAPASAAAERGLLVIQGAGGTTGVLEVPRRLQLAHPRPELAGGRSHAGFLLEPLDPEPGRARAFGAVVIRAFEDDTASTVGFISFEGELAPGRYRVTLLGDAPVRAVYRLANGNDPGLTLTPRTRLRTQFFGRAERLPAVRGMARVDLPGTLPKGRRAVQVALFAQDHQSELRMCATTERDCPTLLPLPLTGSREPQAVARLVPAAEQTRALRWWTEGFRLDNDRLRAAAIVF